MAVALLASRCAEKVKECFDDWIITLGVYSSKASFELGSWLGGTVLLQRVRQLVVLKSESGRLEMPQLSRWSSMSMGADTLARLCREARLTELDGFRVQVSTRNPSSKDLADAMEALIFALDECKHPLASETLDIIMEALVEIGKERMDAAPAFIPPARDSSGAASSSGVARDRAGMEERQHIIEWLKQFECPVDSANYTHSSLRGSKDFATSTGKLCFEDTEEVREKLEKYLARLSDMQSPLAWVEMVTKSYPFFEDIDILGTTLTEGRPEHLIEDARGFWELRAEALHKVFPSVNPLELTLFKAHGQSGKDSCWKASYHALWPQLIVDRERAHAIRLATLLDFNAVSGGPIADLKEKLLAADPRNVWEAVFDQASVKGGSFRMPFCDKIVRNGHHMFPDNRPILPDGIWKFWFNESGQVDYFRRAVAPEELPKVQWLRLGRVRLREPLPPLTVWKPPARGMLAAAGRSLSVGGSQAQWWEKKQDREQRKIENWTDEQMKRRRYFRKSDPHEFKRWLDYYLDDEEGHESTLLRVKAKDGVFRYLWSSRRLKGAVEVQDDGEVFVRGNLEQQVFLIEVLKEFTEEWTWHVPVKMSKETKLRLGIAPARPARRAWSASSRGKGQGRSSERWR